jgi:polyphenol oxidase
MHRPLVAVRASSQPHWMDPDPAATVPRTVMPLFLRSRLLPVPHGFSTREGGVSSGPFASLNLGFKVGDAEAAVRENFQRLAQAAELSLPELHTISQVHGAAILEARAPGDTPGALPPISGEADAIFTARPGAAVGVKTADCVPILLADAASRQVMAVHSGWRGTDAEITARAVETLVARGAKPTDVVAAIGPCIQVCCYEVSEELAERFSARFGPHALQRSSGKPHLDLGFCVRQTLERAGVTAAHIETLPHCTACDPARFFSHRRDAGVSGRHLSFIQCRF